MDELVAQAPLDSTIPHQVVKWCQRDRHSSSSELWEVHSGQILGDPPSALGPMFLTLSRESPIELAPKRTQLILDTFASSV